MSDIEELQAKLAELQENYNKLSEEKVKIEAENTKNAKDLEDARAINKKLILTPSHPTKDNAATEEDEDPDADLSIEEVADVITKECLEQKVMPALTGRQPVQNGSRTVNRDSKRQ